MKASKATGTISFLILIALSLVAGAGCGKALSVSGKPAEPIVTFKPVEMADALHAVIAADEAILFEQTRDARALSAHAKTLRQASESVQREGAEFHYVLRSLTPINQKAAPETETEKIGLQFVLDHPGTNYYAAESLGGRRYFTAVYAETAISETCFNCHNKNSSSPKKNFKTGDVMGGLIVRVPLEF